jgi:murein DD-endopeptidase MepM/ murein hydrolase activator NlpD
MPTRSYAVPRILLLLLAVLGSAVATLALAVAAASEDGWRWPLEGRPAVVRGFDPPPERWGAGHRGVDLRGRPGTAVVAAGAGVVSYAGLLAGRGVVAVRHPGGLETTYEPLRVRTRTGARVEAGDVLGRLDPGHGDCGLGYACLHWGLRRGEDYLDPRSLVGTGPVRLLPLTGTSSVAVPAPPPLPGRTAGSARRPTPVAAADAAAADARRHPVAGAAALTAASAVAGLALARWLSARRRGAAR